MRISHRDFLTLVVVPVIYTWLDDFAVWARARFLPARDDI